MKMMRIIDVCCFDIGEECQLLVECCYEGILMCLYVDSALDHESGFKTLGVDH